MDDGLSEHCVKRIVETPDRKQSDGSCLRSSSGDRASTWRGREGSIQTSHYLPCDDGSVLKSETDIKLACLDSPGAFGSRPLPHMVDCGVIGGCRSGYGYGHGRGSKGGHYL